MRTEGELCKKVYLRNSAEVSLSYCSEFTAAALNYSHCPVSWLSAIGSMERPQPHLFSSSPPSLCSRHCNLLVQEHAVQKPQRVLLRSVMPFHYPGRIRLFKAQFCLLQNFPVPFQTQSWLTLGFQSKPCHLPRVSHSLYGRQDQKPNVPILSPRHRNSHSPVAKLRHYCDHKQVTWPLWVPISPSRKGWWK